MSPRYRDEKIVRSAERPGTNSSPFTDLYIWVCFCWIRGTEVHAMTPCTTERSTMTLPGVADKGIYKADASLVMDLAQVYVNHASPTTGDRRNVRPGANDRWRSACSTLLYSTIMRLLYCPASVAVLLRSCPRPLTMGTDGQQEPMRPPKSCGH